MRLSKIKLAGFKTFVDPTTVTLPRNLSGVVGPNGCGKSNIIDAVRWVMGESSAKNLRGDELTDVIFNGSSARKPVGTAMIELVFDNSDGTIGGEYAGFNEVSIKRVMTREGTSQYFLNNTRCRRKDITRVFLGTGLGARSYSIIEQGMISRVVDAKPEELRVYVEEAAGISKYKDRRRETSNRIRHTRENLERLNDLRDEVTKQLRHLQRQARVAEKYKTLKDEQRQLNAQLIVLRLSEMQNREEVEARLTAEKENELEEAIASQRAFESKIEKSRAAHADQSDKFNEVQESYYKLGAEIARIEQFIQHTRELKQRQQADLDECTQALAEIDQRLESDAKRVGELDRSLSELSPNWDVLRNRAQESEKAWKEAEQAMTTWRSEWQEVQKEGGELGKRVSVEQTRIEHQESQIATLVSRQKRVEVERRELSVDELNAEIATFTHNEVGTRAQLESAKQSLAVSVQDIAKAREAERELTSKLDQTRADQQQQKGRLASLEALQQDALQSGKGSEKWLSGNNLAERPRLATQLKVESGWERAVETVLGDYLEAVCIDRLNDVQNAVSELDGARVTLVEASGPPHPSWAGSLQDKVRGGNVARSLLAPVQVANSLGEALERRSTLGTGESIVTADGIWVGRDWLRVNRDEASREGGVLVREQEIRKLNDTCATLENEVSTLAQQHEQARLRVRELEAKRDEQQDSVNRVHRSHVDLLAGLDARRRQFDDVTSRVTSLAADADELAAQLKRSEEALGQAREQRDAARTALTDVESRRARLEDRQAGTRETLETTRSTRENDRRAAHEVEVKLESQRSSHASLSENLERQKEQKAKLSEKRDALTETITNADQPLASHQEELSKHLEQRLTVESALADARRELEQIDERLRSEVEKRNAAEAEVGDRREAVAAVRISAQEIKVRRDTLMERFGETGLELDAVREEIPEEANVETWETTLADIEQKVGRLGPINLAAIDEHKEASERKEYLDAQYNDLTEALETLEKAIAKIDRETRTRFKETFDQVNQGFQRLFPKLFGGGQAYLELSDTDLLNAGVTVMARPPGKRNSTIHLLSGGEKALTAVSLVFAIFELNPAPFCMLDEVDAPLDDANVNRFCNILREMSDRVQFIFITHNKSTIALAEQLLGVTMQEAGVSRLVAVDVDEAIEMAEAS
ncbi:MAG: chromosome segregation protein SMC [Gammaproteobacteria bacterium]